MELTTLPRTVVRTGLSGLRLPLTVAERLTGSDLAAWAPAQAYDSWEAQAKQVLGSLLHDDQLVREGRLQRARLTELAEAERLERRAAATRRAADSQLDEREAAAEAARRQTEEAAEEARREVEEREEAEKRRIDQAARQRRAATARSAEARRKEIAARERGAERSSLSAKEEALNQREQALATAGRAQALDEAAEAKKAQRKRSPR